MLYIDCPYCGKRAHEEFTYIGDATKKRPDSAEKNDPAWVDYVYTRDNPRGPHLELWHHGLGCREVVKVLRNILTHEILGCGRPADDIPLPEAETKP